MDWRNAFEAVKQYRLPRTRALQEELASLHAEHSAVSGELQEVRAALEQTRADDARQIETLQHQIEHLAQDRDSAQAQTRLLEGSLEEARRHQSATEQRIAALEVQLEDARHQHESNLYLTRDTMSRLQSEQHDLLSLQSDMARTFQEVSHELLLTLKAQGRPRTSVWQLAVMAGLLFLTGALATSLVLDPAREARAGLSSISDGIRELQQLMRNHFSTHDELLEALTRAIGSRDGGATGLVPDTATDPDDSLPMAEDPAELMRGPVRRDVVGAAPADAEVRRDLDTLGLLGVPDVAADDADVERALQRFVALYAAGERAGQKTLLRTVAEQARVDAQRYALDSTVVAAIRLGSLRTGVEFSYLMELAAVESSFDPQARASTSTAAGMFQFKDETWLEAVRKYGDRYGLGYYAGRIGFRDDAQGMRQPVIEDFELQQRVLDLRFNPRLSALLAGERVRASRQQLSNSLAREPARTDLYLSHFFGNTGAISFLKALAENPEQIAGEIFPGPARRNRGIFRKRDDQPRTVAEVYRLLDRKFNTARFEES